MKQQIETPERRVLAPIFGVSRLRMATDGDGVTTLVTFVGCSLRCKWCLNNQCHQHINDIPSAKLYSPRSLYHEVSQDNIYFQMTGGGICFGGGEPLLRYRFIQAFHQLCNGRWKITVETSLNVPGYCLRELLPIVDHWIVDIKDMNPDIYQRYTGNDISPMLKRLDHLAAYREIRKITIRVPHIPDFNTDVDVRASIARLREMGFSDIDEFTYRKPIKP